MFFTPPLPPQPTTVIVWIHGTNPKHFLPPGIAHLTNKMTATLFDCRPGLHKTTDLDMHHYPFILTKTLSQAAPAQFPAEHFYTFGWPGKLTLEDRKIASEKLFSALQTLKTHYIEKDGCAPHFVLISHSHGGNVILHMAEINDPNAENLYLKKIILLACPVQKHTKHLAQHRMFERIYALHSHTDLIQIADPQGFHIPKQLSLPLLSERHFNPHPKIAQACICWKNGPFWHSDDAIVHDVMLRKITKPLKFLDKIKKNRGLFHVEFKLLPFIRLLPSIIEHLDQQIDNGNNCPTSNADDIIMYV
jgi:hypothetical protein